MAQGGRDSMSPMSSQGRSASGGLIRSLAAIGAGAVVLYGAKVLLNLFGPQPAFRMMNSPGVALDSDEFIHFLSVVTDGTRRRSRLRRLKNGPEFYPQYFEAIGRARRSINLEFYEFLPGDVATALVAALTARARAGVEVRMLIDSAGSHTTPDRLFEPLRAAGGQMRWYHPLRWDTWQLMNQRSHRKLLIIDGETGFIGGAGVADHWLRDTRSGPM